MTNRFKMENPPSALRDWAHLPTVAVQLISEKVKSITDFVRFRAVCLPWRSASLPKPDHLPPQLPWLMIPYYPDPKDAYRRNKNASKYREDDGIRLFYDLWQSKMHKLHLPETSGKMCCATYHGWLVLVATQGTEVFLLNPLTRARIELPPFTTPAKVFGADKEARQWFEPLIGNFVISKFSFSTDLTDPNCLIIVLLQRTCQTYFCRVGDQCWTMINTQPEEIQTVTYHDGRFYLLSYEYDYEGVLRVYDLNNPKKRLVFSFPEELQSVTKLLLEGKSGVYMVAVNQIEGEDGEEAVTQEDQDPSDETKEGPIMKIELYQFLEQPLRLRQIIDTSNTIIFYGDKHHCLAICSDDWDSLCGGCMYTEFACEPSAGRHKGEACYCISFTKLVDGKSKLVVRGIGERPRLWPFPPAMWFQPSFV